MNNQQQRSSMQILMKLCITIGSKKKRNISIDASSSMISSDIPLHSLYSKIGMHSSSAVEKMITVVDLTPSAYFFKQEQQHNNSPTSSVTSVTHTTDHIDDDEDDDDDDDDDDYWGETATSGDENGVPDNTRKSLDDNAAAAAAADDDDDDADADDDDDNTARTSCVDEMTLNTETHEKFEIVSRFDSVYLEDDEDYLENLDDYGIPVVQAAAAATAAVDQKRRSSATISSISRTMKRRRAITVGAGFSESSSNILRESLRRLTWC
jgi:hypothetical protein